MFESGDILGFCGEGATSLTIRVATCSRFSHVGCIAPVTREALVGLSQARALKIPPARVEHWSTRNLLFESTTLADRPCIITGNYLAGVQAHNPELRIREYRGGVQLFRLTPAWRQTFEIKDGPRLLAGHLLARIGTQYDGRGAIVAGTRVVKHWWAWSRTDRSSLFCSEYLAGVLQHVGLFPLSNASKVTPASLLRNLVANEIYEIIDMPAGVYQS